MQILPFSIFPTTIADGIVNNFMRNLSNFPIRTTHSTMNPNTFVTGAPKLDFNLMKLDFSECVEVHENNSFQTNSPNSRVAPAATLIMTKNQAEATTSCH